MPCMPQRVEARSDGGLMYGYTIGIDYGTRDVARYIVYGWADGSVWEITDTLRLQWQHRHGATKKRRRQARRARRDRRGW